MKTINSNYIFSVVTFLVIMLSAQLVASEEKSPAANLRELQALFEEDAFSDVYLIGQNLLYELEGNPRFDLIYSVSAIETGNLDEGIFILERLIEYQPSNLRYRLELGRAYFMEGEYEKSETVFTNILQSGKNLPEPVIEKVQGFLIAIKTHKNRSYAQKKHAFNGFVGLALGYDDNPGSVSTIETFLVSDPTTGATGSIPFTNEEETTSYASSQLAGQYTHYINNKTSLLLLGMGQHKNNFSEDAYQFEIGSLLLGADIKRLIKKNLLTFGVKVNRIRRAGEDLYDNQSIRLNYKTPLSLPFAELLNTDISYGEIRYNDTAQTSETDSTRLSIGIQKRKQRFLHKASLILGQEEAVLDTADYNSRTLSGLSYALDYAHTNKLSFSGSILVQVSSYDEVFPSAVNQAQASGELKKRDGVFSALSLGSVYNYSRNISFKANATAIDNDSDLNLYTYKNNKLEMGITYQF